MLRALGRHCLQPSQPGGLPTFLAQTRVSAWAAGPLAHAAAQLPCCGPGGARPLASAAGSEAPPLQFCVVGSGPAGFYTVSQLLKTFGERVRVTILERLPTPFGLVRSGVAPDHPETKNVINQFTELGRDARVRFCGNVAAGSDVALLRLRALFDGVVLAYGAESNRVLDIPGRHLTGVLPAREFVGWYNGHPEHCSLPLDLSKVRRVAVLGLGNVALDCARLLLQPPARLSATDVAPHALAQLQRSAVQRVDVIGRRGPAQAAFTAKELREVLRLEGIQVAIDPAELALTPEDEAALKANRARRRVCELLRAAATAEGAAEQAQRGGRQLRLRFLRSPAEVLGDGQGCVRGLRLEKTRLQQGRALPTGETEELPVELVLESIGYRSLPLPGAPFDESAGVVPNRGGRVVPDASDAAEPLPGLYACGWAKRGPSGIIGTNLTDAAETVAAIAQDVQAGTLRPRGEADAAAQLTQELRDAGVQVVSFPDWLRIDAAERQAGAALGKERLKFTSVQEMLAVLA